MGNPSFSSFQRLDLTGAAYPSPSLFTAYATILRLIESPAAFHCAPESFTRAAICLIVDSTLFPRPPNCFFNCQQLKLITLHQSLLSSPGNAHPREHLNIFRGVLIRRVRTQQQATFFQIGTPLAIGPHIKISRLFLSDEELAQNAV